MWVVAPLCYLVTTLLLRQLPEEIRLLLALLAGIATSVVIYTRPMSPGSVRSGLDAVLEREHQEFTTQDVRWLVPLLNAFPGLPVERRNGAAERIELLLDLVDLADAEQRRNMHSLWRFITVSNVILYPVLVQALIRFALHAGDLRALPYLQDAAIPSRYIARGVSIDENLSQILENCSEAVSVLARQEDRELAASRHLRGSSDPNLAGEKLLRTVPSNSIEAPSLLLRPEEDTCSPETTAS
jgi:hypothetical protein